MTLREIIVIAAFPDWDGNKSKNQTENYKILIPRMVKPPCQTLFFKKKFYKKYEQPLVYQANNVINNDFVKKLIW
jgi:hypothetical protein